MLDDDLLTVLTNWLHPPWHRDALCREYPALSWFPAIGKWPRRQREICGRCLVRDECRAQSIERVEFGIWAGVTAKEREADRARLRADATDGGCDAAA